MYSPPKGNGQPPGATSEYARNTRARAWAYVFDCYYRKKEATRLGSPDDAERSLNDGARNIIQDTK